MLQIKRMAYIVIAVAAIALTTSLAILHGQTQNSQSQIRRIIAVQREPGDSSELTQRDIQDFDTNTAPRFVKARRIAAFKPGRDLLVARGFLLEPYLLLEDNWRNRLRRVIHRIPEFRETRRTGNRISGVYLADTLILPDKTELTGDTVIIANRVLYDGSNVIERRGHNLYTFIIAEQ